MRLIPPELQETDLRPDERHVRVLLHLCDQQIEDLSRIRLEVVGEGLQPARIVVGMGNHYDL